MARSAPVDTNAAYGGCSPVWANGLSVGDALFTQLIAIVVGVPAQLDVSHGHILPVVSGRPATSVTPPGRAGLLLHPSARSSLRCGRSRASGLLGLSPTA